MVSFLFFGGIDKAIVIIYNRRREVYNMFATAKRDTFIHSMNNPEIEYAIPEGKWLFHITSDKQTKYLEFGEIAVWEQGLDGVCYTYEGDWELDD